MANAKKTEVDSFSKGTKILTYVGVGLFAVALLFTLVYSVLNSTGLLGKAFTAMEVGEHKLSVEDFNLYYNEERANLLNQYGAMLQMYYGVDLSQPLDTQYYSDNMTWGDYLRQAAQSTITSTYMVYDEAKKAGFTWGAEEDAGFESAMKTYQQYADSYEMDLEEYVDMVYGTKLDELKDMVKMRVLANAYARSLQDEYRAGITSDAVNSYFESNKDKFVNISYREYLFSYSSGDEASKTEAKQKADAFIAKVKDDKSFIDAAVEAAPEASKETYADEEYTLGDMLWSDKPSGEKATWLCDSARKAGDTFVADTSTSYSCLLFRSVGRDEQNTVNVRHILISGSKPSELSDTATEAEKKVYEENLAAYNEAKRQIESIKATWDASGKTEAIFAEMADKYSDDSPVGGLYEEVKVDEMVEAFNDWIFDTSRKNGDTEIVETEYGFHLIYFVGEGRETWYVDVEDTLVSEEYTKWYDAAAENYHVQYNQKTVSIVK